LYNCTISISPVYQTFKRFVARKKSTMERCAPTVTAVCAPASLVYNADCCGRRLQGGHAMSVNTTPAYLGTVEEGHTVSVPSAGGYETPSITDDELDALVRAARQQRDS
jgi:hypothetical protein